MPMRALYDAQCSLLRDCERKFGFIQNHASKMNPPDFLILLKQVLQTNVGPCNVFLLASNLTFFGIEWKIGLSPSVKVSPQMTLIKIVSPTINLPIYPLTYIKCALICRISTSRVILSMLQIGRELAGHPRLFPSSAETEAECSLCLHYPPYYSHPAAAYF